MICPQFKVCVRCMTFNHSEYILDTLNGFTMQRTNFPFVCCIVDDASTDGEPQILEQFVKVNFNYAEARVCDTDYAHIIFARHRENSNCYFAILLLKENHYCKKKPKLGYLKEWIDNSEYLALCEGDDYWIDSAKLQKQVDFLDSHPDYSMCCTDARILTPNEEKDWKRFENDSDIPTSIMILKGGLFVQTCTLLYRKNLQSDYPIECKKCHVGDYPLQIWMTFKGKVRYFAEKTAVYRYQSANSWTSRLKQIEFSKYLKGCDSEVVMLESLDQYSKRQFHDAFHERIVNFIYRIFSKYKTEARVIGQKYPNYVNAFDSKQARVFRLASKGHLALSNFFEVYYAHGLKPALVSLPTVNKVYSILKH